MAPRDLITAEYVRKILIYNPKHGFFIWRWRDDRGLKWNKRYYGQRAGYVTSTGYVRIEINNLPFNGHRLAWLHHYGEYPPEGLFIDHINGKKADNRIKNLRIASPGQNNSNRRGAQSNNKLDMKGVFLANARWGLYRARVGYKGKTYEAGYFKTPEDAKIARDALAKEIHGKFAAS